VPIRLGEVEAFDEISEKADLVLSIEDLQTRVEAFDEIGPMIVNWCFAR
jgi:hypothetical protein